jgi:hypothetical protein
MHIDDIVANFEDVFKRLKDLERAVKAIKQQLAVDDPAADPPKASKKQAAKE